jgi:hypothetical protein
MTDLGSLRRRVEAARAGLKGLPRVGRGKPGEPDAETGERWDRLNVLGHLAEMLPFWLEQVNGVLEGATEVGRGEHGYKSRRRGVQAEEAEQILRQRIDNHAVALLHLLERLTPEELERKILYRRREGDSRLELGALVDRLLVGHLQEHVEQLQQLGGG